MILLRATKVREYFEIIKSDKNGETADDKIYNLQPDGKFDDGTT